GGAEAVDGVGPEGGCGDGSLGGGAEDCGDDGAEAGEGGGVGAHDTVSRLGGGRRSGACSRTYRMGVTGGMRSVASAPLAAPGTRCSRNAMGEHGAPKWRSEEHTSEL